MRAYRSLGAFACVGKCRSYGAQSAFICVYPGFHFGLCPHSTLGYAGVPPLQGSFHSFICVYPGFHIGLCPHSTLGYAGVSPLQGSFHSFICVYPGFHIGLCPHSTLGYAGVPLLRSSICFYLRLPRVSYRALPLFHPGLCRSAALSGLIVGLSVFTQGFISGFALIPPWAMQECRPCRALYRIVCCLPRVSYRALPSFHPGLCRSVALIGLFAVLDVCGVVSWYCVR